MVKGQRKTRKSTRKQTKKEILTIPELRKAFQHMDKVVEDLRNKSKHSFSDAVLIYRKEWNKTFKRDISPADAASYLKFRYGLKSGKTRRSHMRGGAALPLGGAPLDYQTRPGITGAYGHFPTYQTQGLDRYYTSAINSDCGKPNGFPTDGSATSQAGGGMFDALLRPVMPTAPLTAYPLYPAMMTDPGKGTTPYPSSDPVGQAPFRDQPSTFINPDRLDTHLRVTGYDMYKTAGGPPL
jgi:hypothetical protein